MAKPLNVLKGIVAVPVGIPVAAAATVVLGFIATLAKVGSTMLSNFFTDASGVKTLRFDAGWHKFADRSYDWIESMWKGFAFYPYIETAKFINEKAGKYLYSNAEGVGENSSILPDEVSSNADEKNTNSIAGESARPLYFPSGEVLGKVNQKTR